MIEIKGQYSDALVFTDTIEEEAKSQIKTLCDQSFVQGSKIRIMPDTHAGAGCVIGFTANLGLKNINSKCCDINNVSIKEKYDIIYNSMALHHIVDVKNLINKLYNLINEDGALCIVDLNEEDGRFHKNEKDFNGHNGFNQKWLRDIIKEVGFKSVTSYTFYNGMKNIDDEVVEYSLFILLAVK